MKKLLITSALSLFAFFSFGQAPDSKDKARSNAENFEIRSGKLIRKEHVKVGTIKGCEIMALHLEDLISKEKSTGVRFEYEYRNSSVSDTKVAVLDPDEVEALIKSLKKIQAEILPKAAEHYTEVSFRSRSGFEAGCYFDVDKKDWSTYLKLEKFDGRSYVFLKAADFPQLIELLVKAQGLM